MLTVSDPAPAVKPGRAPRTVAVLRPASPGVPALLRITEGKKADVYAVEPIPADFGTAFAIQKEATGDVYHVNLDGARSVCSCLGFLRWAKCRHIAVLAKLTSEGRLVCQAPPHVAAPVH